MVLQWKVSLRNDPPQVCCMGPFYNGSTQNTVPTGTVPLSGNATLVILRFNPRLCIANLADSQSALSLPACRCIKIQRHVPTHINQYGTCGAYLCPLPHLENDLVFFIFRVQATSAHLHTWQSRSPEMITAWSKSSNYSLCLCKIFHPHPCICSVTPTSLTLSHSASQLYILILAFSWLTRAEIWADLALMVDFPCCVQSSGKSVSAQGFDVPFPAGSRLS